MRLYRCDFCPNEVADFREARWFQVQWFTGEVSQGLFERAETKAWLFCSPACIAGFAEFESVPGDSS